MAHPFFMSVAVSLALLMPAALFSDCEGPVDADGDGYASDVDCDDTNASVHPDAIEPCECDGIDQDCNEVVDDFPCDFPVCEQVDADGDGYPAPKDCDDSDPTINPGAEEPCICDNIDQNCNGQTQDFLCDIACPEDADGDGYGSDVDCNDEDASIHPDAGEPCVCDSIDQDCTGNPVDFDCDIACPVPGDVGDACGADYGECLPGLVCCYPCGIEGCSPNICHEPCFEPWCSGGCPLYP